MITETNKYRTLIPVPFVYGKHEVFEYEDKTNSDCLAKLYPESFAKVYKCSVSGLEFCFGDKVYRVTRSSYDWEVRTVKFTEDHIGKENVFGTEEFANKKLNELIGNREVVVKSSEIKKLASYIKVVANVDFEKVSIEQIKKTLSNIYDMANSIEEMSK
jgi:hypothetical protein